MPDIIQEGHADKLDYGWYEPKHGNIILPKTIGAQNNFVLTPEELAAYDCVLIEMKQAIEHEQENVAVTLRALRKGKTSWSERHPICFTMAHVMEFMVTLARTKLETIKLLSWIAQERVHERRNQMAQVQSSSDRPKD